MLKQLVFAIQCVGFKHQRQAEQVRVGLQRCLYLVSQVLTQVEGIQKALFRLLTQKQDLAGKAVSILVGVHELAANGLGLRLTLSFNTRLGRLIEHFCA